MRVPLRHIAIEGPIGAVMIGKDALFARLTLCADDRRVYLPVACGDGTLEALLQRLSARERSSCHSK